MRSLKMVFAAALAAAAACNDDSVVDPNPGDIWLGFHDAVSYPVGGANPVALAVADVNGDNRADLITLDTALGGARIAVATAAGGYAALGSVTVGAGATDLRVTDVNDDHIGDIAVIGGNELRVSLGSMQGPGAVTTHPMFQGVASALAVGDFDNDLDPDISVITRHASNVGWSLWGRATDGSLERKVDYFSVTAAEGVRVCIGDVTGEDENDVVIATATQAAPLVLLPNTGGASFEQPQIVGAGVLAGSAGARLACGDFDGDRHVDVMLLEPGLNARLAHYRGTAAGLALVQQSLIGNASDIAAFDADGDGDGDLVIGRPRDEAVDLMLNDGQGVFGAPAALLVGAAPLQLAVYDVDRNGFMDLVVTRLGGSIAILKNAGR